MTNKSRTVTSERVIGDYKFTAYSTGAFNVAPKDSDSTAPIRFAGVKTPETRDWLMENLLEVLPKHPQLRLSVDNVDMLLEGYGANFLKELKPLTPEHRLATFSSALISVRHAPLEALMETARKHEPNLSLAYKINRIKFFLRSDLGFAYDGRVGVVLQRDRNDWNHIQEILRQRRESPLYSRAWEILGEQELNPPYLFSALSGILTADELRGFRRALKDLRLDENNYGPKLIFLMGFAWLKGGKERLTEFLVFVRDYQEPVQSNLRPWRTEKHNLLKEYRDLEDDAYALAIADLALPLEVALMFKVQEKE